MKKTQSRFFHTFAENGEINYQGMVVSESGERVTVQWFSWIDGRPTNRQTFNAADANKWRFYASEAAWRRAGDKVFA